METRLSQVFKCAKTGKLFLKCCKAEIRMHKYFVICLYYIRATGYDIVMKNNKYSIIKISLDDLEKTDNINFGSNDPS